MKKAKASPVKKSLLSWVFSGNFKLQAILILTIIITVIIRVFPLEMQKRIVNQAIRLKAMDLLFLYCGLYLAAVVVAGGLKYLIGVLQTIIGQHAVTDMRKVLYRHILMLPLSFYRRTQPGMVVQSFATELATAGDFVGMAVAIPATSVLSLIAFTAYLMWLNPLLAMVSFAIYPLALIVLPVLQKRANMQNKKRIDASRDLSDKIAETVSGIHEIQGYGAFNIESSKFDTLANKILKIRIIWNLYRNAIKVSSNFFTSLSPFIIFILGGYLTIKGRLELGALVAFLSAQEKLFDPWRELIDFYQAYQDASVSYKRTMDYFDVKPEYVIDPEGRSPYQFEGRIETKDLSFAVEGGIQLLDKITISLEPGEQLALVGFSGSGKSTLAHCIGQLYKYTAGHILIDDKEVTALTKRDIAYNIGLVSQAPFIFNGTIEENLLYGCKARLDESGTGPQETLPNLDEIIEVVQQTGIFQDILRFGLNAVLDYEKYSDWVPRFIRVRKKLGRRLNVSLADYVEFFDKEKYLSYSSLAKNLTFGSASPEAFKEKNLSKNKYFLQFLDTMNLTHPLMILGVRLCKQTVGILENLPPDATFFEQSPFAPEELDGYKTLADQLNRTEWNHLARLDQQHLLELALRFAPGKHKIITLPYGLKQQILEARTLFREKISVDHPNAFSFYRKSDYLFSHTILNNLFYGRMKTTNPRIQDTINEQIVQLLIEEDLLEIIIKIGMQFQVGSKGDRLSGGQRQKLAIARALLKKPKILIMDEATSALDNKSQTRIQNLLDTHWKNKATLIAVIHRLDIIKNFDKIGLMKSGKIEEVGTYDELMKNKGLLYELVTGKK